MRSRLFPERRNDHKCNNMVSTSPTQTQMCTLSFTELEACYLFGGIDLDSWVQEPGIEPGMLGGWRPLVDA